MICHFLEALVIRSLRSFRLLAVLCLFASFSAFAQTRLVISQMYGGGGNTGAPFTYDFLELYNPTSAAISLSGLSIQYAAATSASWNSVALPADTVQPGHYYLIQAAAGTTVTGAPLSAVADFVITANGSTGNQLNFSATAGKVVIARGTTALSTACPDASLYVDLIGFGTTANCFEGAGPAAAPSNTTADIRTNVNVDSINNLADFTTGAPTPHNSGSPSVPVAAPTVAIHSIQGVKSTTALSVSPYAGQQVKTSGIVTAVLSNGFFIEAADADQDANPLTPEGIDVFTSSRPTVVVGNSVQVTGTVATFPTVANSHTPATELTSPTITVIAPTATLPTAIPLTPSILTPTGGLYQLTPYEGMRVSVNSVTAVSGTNGSVTSANEANELATSTGYFYGVITGTARPFREPGIDIRDVAIAGAPSAIAQFDDNPERILIDTSIAGGTALEISTGAVLTQVTGVLDFTFSADSFYDPSRLILDATYDRTKVTAGMSVTPVALPASTEFTVASFNIERFYNPVQSTPDDLYYVPAGVNGFNGSSGSAVLSTGQTFVSAAVDVTSAAYARRLAKLSLAIRTVLNSPDIVTLEEVENQSVANDIAAQVNADAGVTNLYTGFSTDNSTFYSQDGTGISVGFLVKNTVNKVGLSQVGQGTTFTPTTSTSPITLNDRPWLVLNAGVKRANAKDYPITVVVNHMKALSGVNSATSTSTRQKKELQAEAIAKYIQGLQANGQHVISGGDFNAFEFSDGYTDTLGTYTNTNVLPATQVVQPGVAGLVTPPLVNLALNLPANQRWSYVEDGSAQILDQMVVTSDLAAAGAHIAYAHIDADFPVTAYNDVTTAARSSDHDPVVGFFALPAPKLAATLTPATGTFATTVVGATSAGQNFTFANTGEGPVTITAIFVSGTDYTVSNLCPGTIAINASCSVNVVFKPTAAGTRTSTLTFATNVGGANYTAALTGTGMLAPDFTLADTAGQTTTSVTVAAGQVSNANLVLTSVSGFAGTVTLSCAATGTAPAGVTCTPNAPFSLVAGTPSSQTVSFVTTSRIKSGGLADISGGQAPWRVVLSLGACGCMLLLASRARRLGRFSRIGGMLALTLALLIPAIGCSSSSSVNTGGTPAGTYTYTITATSGTVSHTEAVTLIVQ